MLFFIRILLVWACLGGISPNKTAWAQSANAKSVTCSSEQAIDKARLLSDTYCSGKNGCHFNARWDMATKISSAQWTVIVSQIHSFDENGMPRFMPDGAIIIKVSPNCNNAQVLTNSL